MDWIERLNGAIDYIEEHLTEEIEFESVADIEFESMTRVALCSSYHFQRMFSYMAEMTISEYIRRRRMSRAAVVNTRGVGNFVLHLVLVYLFAFSVFRIVHGRIFTQR